MTTFTARSAGVVDSVFLQELASRVQAADPDSRLDVINAMTGRLAAAARARAVQPQWARNPDWYRNLQACPEAELVIHGTRRKVHARTASAQERADLWPKIIAAYKGYADYQQRTSRAIPVVICDLQC